MKPQTQTIADEQLLVRRAADGDEAAFAAIIHRCERLVYSVALRHAPTAEDAADIAQETFLKAWRSLSSFRGDCALSTWICRIALNCCVDAARAARTRREVTLAVPEDDGEEDHFLELPDPDPAGMPEEAAVRQEEIEAVREAIDALPDDMRTIVTLRDISGLSYAEIAEILDLEMGTVKSRLNRARAALKKYLVERNF